MTGFLFLEGFSPLRNALVGIVSALAVFGLGTLLVRRLFPGLRRPWFEAVAAVLGYEVWGLAVEGVSMLGWSSLPVSALLGAIGLVGIYRSEKSGMALWIETLDPKAGYRSLFVALAAAVLLLLMACSLSTKFDELFYHMLLPGRVAVEGKLSFYRYPWPSAILPQMVFQLGLAPFHAIGFPHAGNLHSCFLAILLFAFAASYVSKNTGSELWGVLAGASLITGFYPLVFDVTSGPHALGDLAICVALVGLASPAELLQGRPSRFAAIFSLLAVGAATTKLSLLPLALLITGIGLWLAFKNGKGGKQRFAIALAAITPWLLFYAPIALWTWYYSGSPFGPVAAGLFGASAYDLETIRSMIAGSALVNRNWTAEVFIRPFLSQPLFFWPMILFFLPVGLTRFRIVTYLFLVQAVFIALLLPFDLRFFGGAHLALFCLAAVWVFERSKPFLGWTRILPLAGFSLLLLCLGGELYYVSQFVPFVLGTADTTQFHTKYLPMIDDFKRLDKQLEPDAVLLLEQPVRLNSFYSSRAPYFDIKDLPDGVPVYLMRIGAQAQGMQGERVYENPSAVISTSRIPWRSPSVAPLGLFRLQRRETAP